MALAGIHIVCGNAGSSVATVATQALIISPVWSETIAAPGVATNQCRGSSSGIVLVRAHPAADSYVATGTTAAAALAAASSAVGGPRHLALAGLDYDFYANTNEFIAWALA